jgi:putative restriction endonuclease
MARKTNPEWAQLLWPELVNVAKRGKTITYRELAARVGYGHYRLSRQLDPIYYYCKQEKLPPLTILVVSSNTCRPLGVFAEDSPRHQRLREAVWSQPWRAKDVPPLERLAAAIARR